MQGEEERADSGGKAELLAVFRRRMPDGQQAQAQVIKKNGVGAVYQEISEVPAERVHAPDHIIQAGGYPHQRAVGAVEAIYAAVGLDTGQVRANTIL